MFWFPEPVEVSPQVIGIPGNGKRISNGQLGIAILKKAMSIFAKDGK
jgi:hypothetical protein